MHIIFQWIFNWLLGRCFWRLGQIPKVFWLFFVVFCVTSIMTWKFYDLKFNGEVATGIIVGSSEQNSNLKWASFKTAEGEERSLQLPFSVFYSLGDSIEVYYAKPPFIDAYANTFWNAWGVFFLGFVFLVIGVVISFKAIKQNKGLNTSQDNPNVEAHLINDDAPEPPPSEGCISKGQKILSILFLIIALATIYKFYSLTLFGESATAKVISVQEPDLNTVQQNDNKRLYVLKENNERLFFYGDSLSDRQYGERIEIYYNPDHNSHYVMKGDGAAVMPLLWASLIFLLYAWGPYLIRRGVYKFQLQAYKNNQKSNL